MIKLKLLFFSIFFVINCVASDKGLITIGIAPHSSTRVILESHQDLRLFLEQFFKRSVQIVTAKNFSEFTKRSNEGTYYDLILTSPNLAILAQKLGSYTPLMTYQKGLSTIILSKEKDILNKDKFPLHVVGLDPVSFPTLDAQEWLEKKGFKEGKEIRYSYTSATDSSISILMNNHADMIIMSLPNYLKLMTNKIKKDVYVIYESKPKPSRIYLAKNKNGISVEQWKKALEAFSKSKEGKHHLKITKLENFKEITPKTFQNLEEIVNKTMKRLYK